MTSATPPADTPLEDAALSDAAPSETPPSETPPADSETVSHSAPVIDRRMLEALICPQTMGSLRYDAARQELISDAALLAFPIRDGIPIMLVSAARSI